MIQGRLAEIGFENLPKDNEAETFEAMLEQVEDDPNIAAWVLEILHERHDPEPVHDSNYDELLSAWIADQVCLLFQPTTESALPRSALIPPLF